MVYRLSVSCGVGIASDNNNILDNLVMKGEEDLHHVFFELLIYFIIRCKEPALCRHHYY
jgi:hypothetical protein